MDLDRAITATACDHFLPGRRGSRVEMSDHRAIRRRFGKFFATPRDKEPIGRHDTLEPFDSDRRNRPPSRRREQHGDWIQMYTFDRYFFPIARCTWKN